MPRNRNEFIEDMFQAVKNVGEGAGEVELELAWICRAAPKLFVGKTEEQMEEVLRKKAGQIARINIIEVSGFWQSERGILALRTLQNRLAGLPERRQKG